MGLVFNGDLDNISERQLDFIRDVLEKRGYKNIKVLLEPVGKDGDNYGASVKRVIIQDANGVFKIIAKIAPQNEMARMAVNSQRLFKNEHHMYTEILPKLLQLQIDADVPKQERLRFADCYGSLSEQPHEVILLEDLTVNDFTMLDRLKAISEECVRSVLKNFGILHSLSFVLKEEEPETFRAMASNLFDTWGSSEKREEAKMYFEKLENDSSMRLQSEKHKRAIKGAIVQGMSLAAKLAKSDAGSKHSVILQGDAWTNNIMFKFNGENSVESIMIDYQISKEGSPASDILYMIFNCTDHETRLQHYHDWIDYYHLELDKSLSNFGLKANYLYPRDRLDADLKRYGKMMFGLTVLLANVLTMNSDDASKIKDALETGNMAELETCASLSGLDQAHTLLFIKKLEGLVDSCLEFGLL